MQNKRRGSVLIWIGIVALVVIVLLLIFWKPNASQNPSNPGTGTQTGAPQPTFAPQGQTVAGFPKDLILDPNASIGSSYSLNYAASTNQYTAQWNSSMTMAALFAKYTAYFSANGWTITNQQSKPQLDSIYAKNTDGSEANLAIYPQGTGNEVIISYVAQ
ncbi:MAG TPA: hypothetical protein VMU07_00695 [Candidatus Paceibacterota bacterium]|nr:hypothetical protein [Candidatus Paceibacterota bacterium]